MKNSLYIIVFLIIKVTTYQFAMAQNATINYMAWKVAAHLPPSSEGTQHPGLAGALSGMHNNVLLVAGGANFPDSLPWMGGKKKYYSDIYVFYNDGKGNLKPIKTVFQLPQPLAYSATVSTPLGVVAIGGENESGITNTVLLLQWDHASKNIVLKNLPLLPFPLTSAAAATDGKTIYVAGGESTTGAAHSFFSLDLHNTSAEWKLLPALPRPVSHAVLAVQSNGNNPCVYLIGGRKKNINGASDLYPYIYQYDPGKKQWKEKAPLPYSLSAGTGIASGKESILLFGGDKGVIFRKTESLIAMISEEKDDSRKAALNQMKMEMQANHQGFSNDVLRYNTVTDSWSVVGIVPFKVPVTTTAVRWGNCVLITSGELRPGIRTPEILAAELPDE